MDHGDEPKPPHEETTTPDSLDWQAYRILSIQPHGFRDERIRIWPKLVHVTADALDHQRDATDFSTWSDVSFEQLVEDPVIVPDVEPHVDERQIELDTDRSFVLYPVEGVSSREKLQTALNRLIVSVFRRRPRLHYFQGYHDIVSVIFLTLPKELHIPVTEKLSLHRVRDSMGTNLDPVVGLLRILKKLLRLADPQFASVLERTAPLPYYALSNLLTLFSHDVPTLPLIQHIFDYLLCRPPIAVVYLAAAFILTRRKEVQMLEDEGEDGMIHSLLTVLPDLYEEGEELSVAPKVETPEPFAASPVKGEEVELGLPSVAPPTATDGPDHPLVPQDGESPGSTQGPTPDVQAGSAVDPADPTSSATTELNAEDDVTTYPVDNDKLSEPTVEPLLEPETNPTVKTEPPDSSLPLANEDEDEKPPLRTASPEPVEREPRPHRPRASLTSLLKHADELYALYPPSHPGIALASVMGPQSAMLTWSERAADLPDDDEAELMVTRPELIVLPYVEEPLADDDERDGDGGPNEKARRRKEREERRRKKLRKPRRLTDIVVQRKTMVAGAVLVLGVAMAVYGLNGGLPGAGGNGHHRTSIGRKMGKLIGGVWMTGGRVFDGIRRGLE